MPSPHHFACHPSPQAEDLLLLLPLPCLCHRIFLVVIPQRSEGIRFSLYRNP
jgi:hypothetical protein